MNKIALGTAQFGMDYGINNKKGRIPKKEVFKILDMAHENGINMVDTAYAYGDSEKIIGDYIKKKDKSFHIVSKLPKCELNVAHDIFKRSLVSLGVDILYGYLLHSFSNYNEESEIWNFMCNLKEQQKVRKIGFSLYFPSELEMLLRHRIGFDIIQVPYNIFDRRFEEYFKALKAMGIEIHVRSVFLQGLLLKKPETLGRHFDNIKNKLKRLQEISALMKVPVMSNCIHFAINNDYIDKIVVGVDNSQHLEQIIQWTHYFHLSSKNYERLCMLREDNEDILLPFKWNLN